MLLSAIHIRNPLLANSTMSKMNLKIYTLVWKLYMDLHSIVDGRIFIFQIVVVYFHTNIENVYQIPRFWKNQSHQTFPYYNRITDVLFERRGRGGDRNKMYLSTVDI